MHSLVVGVLARIKLSLYAAIVFACLTSFSGLPGTFRYAEAADDIPTPLLEKGHSVDWWFVFKFNSKSFPGCGDNASRACPFGGSVQTYQFGQQYVYASSENSSLQKGGGCA